MQKKENHDLLSKHLVENSIALQKASLQLIESSTQLTKRIDKLVSIFENASSHIAEVELNDDKFKNLAVKLENLLDQNKEIARGLLLLEQYIRSKTSEPKTSFEKPVTEFKF
ncbi:hypothetical protein J4471_04830 [Candidatus Woesearchaeota archaeon]|nr:hypothetical protein [Candidatus Woesearchaeota archaeon]